MGRGRRGGGARSAGGKIQDKGCGACKREEEVAGAQCVRERGWAGGTGREAAPKAVPRVRHVPFGRCPASGCCGLVGTGE